MTTWAGIPDFPNYAVSDLGEVANIVNDIFAPVSWNDRTGLSVDLTAGTGRRTWRVIHRIVASAFTNDGEITKQQQLKHEDGDKRNNRLSNLLIRNEYGEWVEIVRTREQLIKPMRHILMEVHDQYEFTSIAEAAKKYHGLSAQAIQRSAMSGRPTAKGHQFTWLEEEWRY